jgi:hypothetical protein
MTGQEQAFRAYYASMTDAELLRIAANKTSFIDVAQKILADELMRRNLTVTLEALPGAIVQSERTPLNVVFTTLAKRLGGVFRR